LLGSVVAQHGVEGDGLTRVAVIGGGIGGLAVALLLGRRGHSVTVFERDARAPNGDLDRDFFSWHRPRTPQSVQPHGLLAPVRTVLMAELPDVYAAMLRMGATERHEFDWFAEHPPARAGDEDLVTLQTRRIVLETALSDAVGQEHGVELRRGDPVEGLVVDRDGSPPRVVGLRAASGTYHAELVLDAGGRRSRVVRWLAAAGCREAVVENHGTGIAYFCRWYRLPGAGPQDPGRVKSGSAAEFAIGGVFPSDNGTFAVAVTVSTADPTRTALRDPQVFEAVARSFPAVAAWLALEPEAVSDVHVMAGLDNRWTSLVDRAGPVVTGLVGVGDAVTHTNPTLGQGVALALRAGQWVASHAERAADDPGAFAEEYHRWAELSLKPWFDAQVVVDGANAARLGANAGEAPGAQAPDAQALGGQASARPAPTGGATGPGATAAPAETAREKAARTLCAYDDPVVMRARAKVRHLLATPDQAYGTEEVRTGVARWLAERPDFEPGPDGPSREHWESLIDDARRRE
jgi:2-polyprenyl-6-methoxyphenol hydroxylase-like FAD-dependent oxidoreductase